MNFDRIKKVIAEHLEIEESEITEETSFEDLGVDSLDTIEMLMKLEDEFGIEIKVEDVGKTIGTLNAYIEANI